MAIRSVVQRLNTGRLRLTLRHGQPAISLKDLGLMLEIEAFLGRRKDFQRRLSRAIVAAYRLGAQNKNLSRTRIGKHRKQ